MAEENKERDFDAEVKAAEEKVAAANADPTKSASKSRTL